MISKISQGNRREPKDLLLDCLQEAGTFSCQTQTPKQQTKPPQKILDLVNETMQEECRHECP